MRKNYKFLYFISAAFALLAVVGVVLRTAALFTVYDSDIGYYQTSAVLPDIFHIVCIAAVAFAALSILFLPEKAAFDYAPPSSMPSFVRGGAAFAIVASSAYVGYVCLGLLGDRAIYTSVTTGAGTIVEKFAAILGFASIIYFALVLAGKAEEGEKHVYFGYCVILFVLMILAKTYFDFYTTMNSPNKLLLQISFMSIMLYMLYELRFPIGSGSPRGYWAISLAAFYLTAVCSIPGIIAFFAGIFTKNEYFVCHFLSLGFCAYIGARLLSFIRAQKKQ